MPDLTNGSVIITSPLAPATRVTAPAQSSSVLTTPGRQGPPGPGLELAGAVATYAELPDDLGPSDAGAAYVVNADGLLYVWDGTAFPADGNGSEFKGDQGDPGRGITDLQLIGDDVLRAVMSDASNEDVTIPAITAAAASAAAAAASASTASTASGNAATSASSAAGSATNASNSASAAAASATSASNSAATATTQAANAADSATSADSDATAAAASASAADDSATDAAASASDAATSASNAATSASGAATSATNASSSASGAAASATAAADSAAAAAASADEAEAIIAAGIPEATATVKGGIKIPGGVDGEIGGTFDHPTVTGWANKADLVAGKIPTSQIPAFAISDTFVVTDEAARLALTAETGDVAVQTGNPGRGTYILKGTDPTNAAHWELMVTPTDAVTSVNGYNGAVVLVKSDLGLANADNTSDANKPISTATQTALDGKAATSHTHNASDVNAGTLGIARIPTGSTSSTVCIGDDSRLSNARTPTAHTHNADDVNAGTLGIARIPTGTSSSTVCIGNDGRLTDTRTPSANTVPSDFVLVAVAPTTTRSTVEDWTVGQYVGRAFTLTKVVYQFETADASGNTSCEVQRNGSQVTSSNVTVSAANQADGTGTDTARTATPNQSFAVGDRINVVVTAVGTTPGKGLRAYLLGTWN